MSQKMTWEQIRQCYPHTFVLLDHCEEKRVDENHVKIVGGEVVLASEDGKIIFDEYRRRGKPADMNFGHTQWTQFEIEEISLPGLRLSNG